MSPCYYCEADDDICKTCIHSNTYEDPYIKLDAIEKQRDMLFDALMSAYNTSNALNPEHDYCVEWREELHKMRNAITTVQGI